MANDGDTMAELAQLSGANLVRYLQTTNRMADYKVAAHVFGEHERRAAETEAYLQAKIDSPQMECDLLAKECAYSEGGKKTNIDSNINEYSLSWEVLILIKIDQEYVLEEETVPLLPSSMQQPSSLGLISMRGSPIAPALVATSFASVADMSPPLVEESDQGNIEMQNQLSHLHLNNLMDQLSFDAWMEETHLYE
uniref:Uncharacterized protein n=1 Tax=Oryza rufipogon TaxID=4529 RepID=A0A0E0P7Y1_ORYRU